MPTELVRKRPAGAELETIDQSIAQIVDAIADGMYHASMKEKMSGLKARKQVLRAELDALGKEICQFGDTTRYPKRSRQRLVTA